MTSSESFSSQSALPTSAPRPRPLPLPLIWLRTRRRRLTVAAALCLLIYVSVLFTLTHLPKVPHALEQANDKSLHFMAYFVLGGLSYVLAVLAAPRLPGLLLLVLLACAAFGAVDEITQPFFGRTADVMDWRADTFGALTAIAVLGTVRFFYRRFVKSFAA